MQGIGYERSITEFCPPMTRQKPCPIEPRCMTRVNVKAYLGLSDSRGSATLKWLEDHYGFPSCAD